MKGATFLLLFIGLLASIPGTLEQGLTLVPDDDTSQSVLGNRQDTNCNGEIKLWGSDGIKKR